MKKIDAIQLVREIRDQQSKELAGKSTQEMIIYFHKKASTLLEKKKKALELNKR